MKIVWLVLDCDYDQTCLRGVFSSQEKALDYKQRRDAHEKTDHEIEEWEIDAALDERPYPQWFVEMRLSDGRIEMSRREAKWGYPESRVAVTGRYVDAYSVVSAEHALNLAVEARKQWLHEHQ